jgi:Response regulator containing CheY-like receiver, AAA-type ATPase, and DNA-binding domains
VDDNKIKILILEDDESLGKALYEVLTRNGHQVFLAARPDEGTDVLNKNTIDYLFCDCLLPQMTGLDYVEKMHKQFPQAKFKTVMMSGIYTDKQFIQEATQKTQALAFLKKPFDMEQVLKLVKKDAVAREEVNARKLLYQMFSNPKVTARQKRKVIESIEEVSGFDLPFIYSLLVETKSSGYLNIYNDDGSVSGISFSNGNIVSIDVDDKTTFLGEMLIQSGYATPADVQNALRDKNNRRIGSYLIQNNQLSPHAFDLILMEQMNIRVSKTILDQKIRVNFAAAEVEMTSPSIDSEALLQYLHDWIASKLSVSWLKSLYRMYSGNVVTRSPSFRPDHEALTFSLIKTLDGFVEKLDAQMTLNQLLNVPGYSEIAVYKAIHFLLTRGLVVFAERRSFANQEEQLQFLNKLWSELDGKNPYEFVAYMEMGAMGASAEGALIEFIKILGDAPSDHSSEVSKKWLMIKAKAEEAAAAGSDTKQVSDMKKATERTEAEAKLKASSLMEDVRKHLQMNQYGPAGDKLSQINKIYPQVAQFHIFHSWHKLATMRDDAKKQFVLKEVELDLMQVPPDERYDAVFPFVMGMFNKVKGDVANARKSFEKSIALDHSFMPARRELSMLSAQNKKQDVFNMDLKEMVSGFFKKR